MRIADLRMLSRDDDVAKQRNRRAEADGMAIDPRDDRLRGHARRHRNFTLCCCRWWGSRS